MTMRLRKDPRQWDKPGMQRALASPVNQRPVRFDDIPRDDMFDPDERQHVDRDQARALKYLLTGDPDRGILDGDHIYDETPEPEEEDSDA